MPRVLQAMFSKKAPKPAPEIPDYDTFVLRYNNKKNSSEDTNVEEFRTDAWWLDKSSKKSSHQRAEIKAGGEKALNNQLPSAMNVSPEIDEETEAMMRDFFYGNQTDDEEEIL